MFSEKQKNTAKVCPTIPPLVSSTLLTPTCQLSPMIPLVFSVPSPAAHSKPVPSLPLPTPNLVPHFQLMLLAAALGPPSLRRTAKTKHLPCLGSLQTEINVVLWKLGSSECLRHLEESQDDKVRESLPQEHSASISSDDQIFSFSSPSMILPKRALTEQGSGSAEQL